MRKRWLGIIALGLIAASIANFQSAPDVLAAVPSQPSQPTPTSYSDRVIVQYATQASHEFQEAGGKAPSLEAQGFRELTVPKGMTRDAFIAQLQSQPGVVSAEPDGAVYAADIPNDPYYLPNQASYLQSVGAPAAWALDTGSHQVIVAVLDSGIDLNHPDLVNRLWQNPNDAYNDGIDHDHNGCINDRYGCRFVSLTTQNQSACGYGIGSSVPNGNVADDNGTGPSNPGSHGTFVAGIIGAQGNNGQGVTGVAWDVQLMTVKVLDCGSDSGRPRGSIADVARGIDYARLMGANIINLSLATQQDSTILRTAVQQAVAQGIIVVAAAGNFGGTSQPGPGYPAAYSTDYPGVVAVAASDNTNGNQWASYSAYGPAINLAAPGNMITSTIRSDIGIDPPYGETGSPSQGYEGGTSFAAPQVAGMFALMMSRNPGLGAAQYISLAENAATPAPSGPANWAGSGIINIGKAVAMVPMTVSGGALHDWIDLPPGEDLKAMVGSTVCGETTVTAFGRLSNYDIRVSSAAEKAGCGSPGVEVQMVIDGQPAYPQILWGGQNANLGLTGQDVSTISAEPGATVNQQLNGQWSNIAYLGVSGAPELVLGGIPSPWTAAYFYNPFIVNFTGNYGTYLQYLNSAPLYTKSWATVRTFDAFWVNGAAATYATANPGIPNGRTVLLQRGWNNITYTGTNRQAANALQSIAGQYSTVLHYDNVSQTWQRYTPGVPRYQNDFGGLFTFQVYWIYMNTNGALTMN